MLKFWTWPTTTSQPNSNTNQVLCFTFVLKTNKTKTVRVNNNISFTYLETEVFRVEEIIERKMTKTSVRPKTLQTNGRKKSKAFQFQSQKAYHYW